MTTRHRKSSTDHAYYHAVPQSPLAPNPAESSELDPENEEDAVDETLLPVEVPTAIRLVHFVFGCAVLLPWNCLWLQNYLCGNRCSLSSTAMITATPYFLAQLEGSSLQHVFPSYLSLIFTMSNFLFLAYATATARQVRRDERECLRV